MSKINRIVAFLLSTTFVVNSASSEVVVNALTEMVQEYQQELLQLSEEQQEASEDINDEKVTAPIVTETTYDSASTAITKQTETTESAIASEITQAVTTNFDDIRTENDDLSSDTSNVVFETLLDGDTEINSVQKTEYNQNTKINGSLTVKSGSELHVKQGTIIEITGDLIVEPDASLNVSEMNIKTIVRGNLMIDGKLHYSSSPVIV
jgi:hypothetical protein